MALHSLKEFAISLAVYARKKLHEVPRGALLIRCISDGNMIAAIFGNDNFRFDPKVRREVELVRKQLKEAEIDELGFGLSHDGFSWALLVKAEVSRYQTVAGKAFQTEMLKVYLEDVVWRAWRDACGVAPDLPELATERNIAHSSEA
jgi:hypothetical protein